MKRSLLLISLVAGFSQAGPKGNAMSVILDTSKPHAQRMKAAQSLGTSKDPLAIDTLVKALQTMDVELRDAAVASLKKQKAELVFAKRIQDKSTTETLRISAAIGLRHLKDVSTASALATALNDQSAAVRKEAALALSVIGPASAENALIDALSDADDDVRYFVAEASGSLKSAAAKKALAARLDVEKNPTVRFALEAAKEKQNRP
jgi:HEAT repeat protein